MNFEVSYDYSPELIEKSAKEYLVLRAGWPSILSVIFLGIVGVAISFSPSYQWVGGFLVALVLIYTLQSINFVRNAKKLASELPNKAMVVKFNDEGVVFQSESHTSSVKWKRFFQVWITKHAWLFFIYSANNFTMIPSSYVSEELRSFILSKMTKETIKDYQRRKTIQ